MHLGWAACVLGDKRCPPRVGWQEEVGTAATTACSACRVPKLVPVGASMSWHGHIAGERLHCSDFSRAPEHLSTSVLQLFLCPQRGLSPAQTLPQGVPAAGLCCGRTCPALFWLPLLWGQEGAWGSWHGGWEVLVVVLKTEIERKVLGVERGSGAECAREMGECEGKQGMWAGGKGVGKVLWSKL